jgi:hypothetical protein
VINPAEAVEAVKGPERGREGGWISFSWNVDDLSLEFVGRLQWHRAARSSFMGGCTNLPQALQVPRKKSLVASATRLVPRAWEGEDEVSASLIP